MKRQYKLRDPHVRKTIETLSPDLAAAEKRTARRQRVIMAIMFVAAFLAFALLVFMAVAWMVWLSGGAM